MSETPAQYVVSYDKPRTNHILHLLLTLVTFGLWLVPWLLISVNNAQREPERKVTTVYTGAPPTPDLRQRALDDNYNQRRIIAFVIIVFPLVVMFAFAFSWVFGLIALAVFAALIYRLVQLRKEAKAFG